MKYRVVLLTIPHFECLRELAEMLVLALQEAGLTVALTTLAPAQYRIENGTQDILLGVHAAGDIWDDVPPRATLGSISGYGGTPAPIVYQTENLVRQGTLQMPSWWRRMALRAVIWDYSSVHATQLHTRHVPLGYVRSFVRPLSMPPFPDIDVLFYGSINDRRRAVLDRMTALGLQTKAVFGVYGKPLDELIARSKVVLNVHFYTHGLFESVRVLPLLHRGACVLGEESAKGEGASACLTVPYAELPEAALGLVRGDRYLVQRAEDHVRLRQQRALSAVLCDALIAALHRGRSDVAACPDVASAAS